MTARLIGLGGRLRAGKDAVADHLVAKHGFVKLGMSDALHEALLAIDPIVECWDAAMGGEERYSDLIKRDGYVEAKKNPEVRRLLQKLGTEVGRDMIYEDVWADIMARKVDALHAEGKDVVVTGVRFPNEVDMVRGVYGKAVWIERPTAGETSSHASESSVSAEDFDVVIHNTGTLDDLYVMVDLLAGD